MLANDVQEKENERLKALSSYSILDTPPEQSFENIIELAIQICGAPLGAISFVDEKRQWFKSKIGLEISETPRENSFCTHAISGSDLFIVPDSHGDMRFAQSPLLKKMPQI